MDQNQANLRVAAQKMSDWLRHVSVPFWCEYGVDRQNGGYFEALDLDGHPLTLGYKRTRVTARQIYSFSHSALTGNKAAGKAAEHGYDFLIRAHQGLKRGTWNRLVNPDGSMLDATQDLYDLAFVLFALAWWYKLSGQSDSLTLAKNTIQNLPDLRHPTGLGFKAAEDLKGAHQQNPHMHLLEALLALYEATNDDYFILEAKKIVDLFQSYFLVDGSLREYFDGEWRPVAGEQGRYVEPGHMAEWAWILGNYSRCSGANVDDLILATMRFVENVAQMSETGLLPDVVFPDSSVAKASVRLWPQTELLKGLVTVSELTGSSRAKEICQTWKGIETNFLLPAPAGTWHDHFDGSGKLIVDKIPASSLYHISVAINEVARCDKRLNSQ